MRACAASYLTSNLGEKFLTSKMNSAFYTNVHSIKNKIFVVKFNYEKEEDCSVSNNNCIAGGYFL